ncbi:APC family permease [candidate division KSB1 bacterium]
MFDSIMMMVGIVIGSGIFLTTGLIAQDIPSSSLILLVWMIGGIIVLTGALTYAELGASLPHAGGQYVYLKEAYGSLYGFLFGWKMFLVSMSGSIAALGIGFAVYLSYFFQIISFENYVFVYNLSDSFSISLSTGQIAAVFIIIVLSLLNYLGVVYGKVIQNMLTSVKIFTLLVFILFGIYASLGNSADFTFVPELPDFGIGRIIVGLGIALIAVSWAFDGWNNINYIAGEIKDPKRNLTAALVLGTLIITSLYVLVNFVYVRALSVEEMSGVVRIAEKSATTLFGDFSAGLLSAAILISIVGALNGTIFVGPRVYYAMAKDGLFFKKVAEIHPKYGTPAFGLVLQAVWSAILALTGTYEQLFTFAMFVGILFWIGAAGAVFTLRKKQPDLSRPYKTWGYPYTPIIFIISLSLVLVNAVIEKPIESLSGILFTLIGIPVFYYWRNKSKPVN